MSRWSSSPFASSEYLMPVPEPSWVRLRVREYSHRASGVTTTHTVDAEITKIASAHPVNACVADSSEKAR
jgi:hypothetical protein